MTTRSIARSIARGGVAAQSSPLAMSERTYSRDEMEAILRHAIGASSASTGSLDGVRHEELLAAAREVGVDPGAIEAAVGKLDEERALARRAADEDAIVERAVRERKSAAKHALLRYAIVVAFAAAVDWLTPGGPWAQWVVLSLALVGVLRVVRAWRAPSADDRSGFVRREQRRRAKEAAREARSRAADALSERLSREHEARVRAKAERQARDAKWRAHGEELGRVVEERVSQIVSDLTSRLETANQRGREPSGDFGAYVRRERGKASAEAPPSSARVRVEAPPDAPPSPRPARADAEDDAEERSARRRPDEERR